MSDAAKRLRHKDEAASTTFDGYEVVSPTASVNASKTTMSHRTSCVTASGKVVVPPKPLNGIPLPRGVESMEHWAWAIYVAPSSRRSISVTSRWPRNP